MELSAFLGPLTTEILAILFLLFYGLTLTFTITVIILEGKNPTKSISWMVIVLFFPVFGILLYLRYGRNFRKEKLFSAKSRQDSYKIIKQVEDIDLSQTDILKKDPEVKPFNKIMKLAAAANKAMLTDSNSLKILENGAVSFPAMLNGINQARHHIHLCFYSFEEDDIGIQFIEALIKKAKEGVEIRGIFDGIGSWGLSKKIINDLKESGIEVEIFMPVRFPLLTSRLNYRNHRKILIIDGITAFTGGLNIAERYSKIKKDTGFWRDTHIQITGKAATCLQSVFLQDWRFVCKRVFEGPEYFPKYESESNKLVQIAASGPDSEEVAIMQAYFTAITTAREYIYISTPYFVPNEAILTALETAALSGVKVKLLLPGMPDHKTLFYTSLSFAKRLIYTGVDVYIYKKGFNHGKVIIVDGIFSSVGTANMDERSFEKNFEVNAFIYDKETTELLSRNFENDLMESDYISPEEFKKRPTSQKILEGVARMISPLL
ncbi:cardiolipin synthase [Marinigracilibium pacificum]|uniref:Cardiolipin synthase n=1 Tax=Marinigracilibium pacificum TaxID=2729599 RepID=A0A848J6J8_9BACT|nr:cardiolipin synthase [Marinigracilibium pacificum]NMM50140.1 cardiolipin synthase [Marinigracilibium pacificum]